MTSTITTPAKPRYYSPRITVDAVVSLDEFSDDDLLKEIQHRSLNPIATDCGTGGTDESGMLWIEPQDVDRIRTLALCGQRKAALDWLLEILRERTEIAL